MALSVAAPDPTRTAELGSATPSSAAPDAAGLVRRPSHTASATPCVAAVTTITSHRAAATASASGAGDEPLRAQTRHSQTPPATPKAQPTSHRSETGMLRRDRFRV
eukprot:scaffold22654_cov101-Isochrysis_galbana.AAC.2